MAFQKSEKTLIFGKIGVKQPFYATTTLYTRSEGKEEPKGHFLIKVGKNCAMTPDRKTVIYFGADDLVNPATSVFKK